MIGAAGAIYGEPDMIGGMIIDAKKRQKAMRIVFILRTICLPSFNLSNIRHAISRNGHNLHGIHTGYKYRDYNSDIHIRCSLLPKDPP